jgi:DNA-binding transcriptional MerR regulator
MLESSNNNELPPIPAKKYFSIGEVSDLCGVKPHVLRYWEQEFPQLTVAIKRRGNRRYYQHTDVLMIRQVRSLLYEKGYTIGGAKAYLDSDSNKDDTNRTKQLLHQMITELEEVLELLK